MHMKPSIAFISILTSLAIPAGTVAHSTPSLPIPIAQRAITTYEHSYWRGQPVTFSVADCHRRSRVTVTCVASVQSTNRSLRVTDWATRLASGMIRVHPGQFEEDIVLA